MMKTFALELCEELRAVLKGVLPAVLDGAGLGLDEALGRVMVTPATNVQFGDYQSNVAMVLAKRLKRNPRALAEEVAGAWRCEDLALVEVAGGGFLNFRLTLQAFAGRLQALLGRDDLGVMSVEKPETVVVDFSAPNVAKPMHVGHIRSTIIGESLARVGRCLGHRVITDNHLGDWGTQFGMVLWGWKQEVDEEALARDALAELLRLYRFAKRACDEDEAVLEACRQELVRLQGGEADSLAIWRRCVEVSRERLEEIYERLGVSFDHWLGESAYHEQLAQTVQEFLDVGLARETEGAVGVFTDGELERKQDPFLKKEKGEWVDHPLLIRKRDGGFNYATTDVATLDYRVREWGADLVLYVVDHRQSLHFRQLFEVARRRGYEVRCEHIAFGTILGKDGKPLKTRAGDLPQLEDVLDDAVAAAGAAVAERSVVEDEGERERLAELIGLSAVKFTELSHHRMSDYVFDLEKMVSLEGDTAPYLQYSYVRCQSIFRKLGEEPSFDGELSLSEPGEVQLARVLCRYAEVVPAVWEGFRPNLLANYLIELARAFHSFFQSCPVLKAEGQVRTSRLALCALTARTLRAGLGLLAVEVPERM